MPGFFGKKQTHPKVHTPLPSGPPTTNWTPESLVRDKQRIEKLLTRVNSKVWGKTNPTYVKLQEELVHVNDIIQQRKRVEEGNAKQRQHLSCSGCGAEEGSPHDPFCPEVMQGIGMAKRKTRTQHKKKKKKKKKKKGKQTRRRPTTDTGSTSPGSDNKTKRRRHKSRSRRKHSKRRGMRL